MDRVDLGQAVADAVTASGYQGRLWTTSADEPQVRVYVTRSLSGGRQDMGYVEILGDASRNYNGLSRNKAGVRDDVEAALVPWLAAQVQS